MSQRVAYVTGGMGGIGTSICQRLHKDGFKVIAGCGPTRDFDKWLAEQKALGYTFYASVGNVADWNSTVEAFGKAKAEQFVSVLVNKVGSALDISNIILAGGGAEFFKDVLADKFPKHEIITTSDPVFANVRGFQRAGQQFADQMFKRG